MPYIPLTSPLTMPMKALYKALMRPIRAFKNPDELAGIRRHGTMLSSQEGLIMHVQLNRQKLTRSHILPFAHVSLAHVLLAPSCLTGSCMSHFSPAHVSLAHVSLWLLLSLSQGVPWSPGKGPEGRLGRPRRSKRA